MAPLEWYPPVMPEVPPFTNGLAYAVSRTADTDKVIQPKDFNKYARLVLWQNCEHGVMWSQQTTRNRSNTLASILDMLLALRGKGFNIQFYTIQNRMEIQQSHPDEAGYLKAVSTPTYEKMNECTYVTADNRVSCCQVCHGATTLEG